jgi:hypothetical protein
MLRRLISKDCTLRIVFFQIEVQKRVSPYKNPLDGITSDNASELAVHKIINKCLRFAVYFTNLDGSRWKGAFRTQTNSLGKTYQNKQR